jgi:hypothetical protein
MKMQKFSTNCTWKLLTKEKIMDKKDQILLQALGEHVSSPIT